MKQHQGIWLPDHETHMVEWCNKNGEMVDGKTTYQYKKLVAALQHVRQWRTAVDVGAHVGFWSMHLEKRFNRVEAFEPMAEHRECFLANLADSERASLGGAVPGFGLQPYALGAAPAKVAFAVPFGSSGGTHVSGAGDVEVRTLDSFEFDEVDFLKIDVEGMELAVLQGAVATLERCRPTIIVEQKAHTPGGQKHLAGGGTPAVDFLLAMGAKQRQVISGDYILSWD